MRMIAMIGTFPPPMHGMAAVNSAMKDFFVSSGENPEIFDLSAISLSKVLHVRLIRATRVLSQLVDYCNFLRVSRKVSVYISVSGGYGQFFEILFVLLSRLRNARIVLHHHSFLYIDRPRFLTKMLVFCSGKDAYHIALCGLMVQKLKSHSSRDLKRSHRFIREMDDGSGIWSVGYFVSTIGLNEQMIEKYIANQDKQDRPKNARLGFS